MEARPYQVAALDQIRSLMAEREKKILLHLATGGGKTFIFCNVLRGAYAKGRRALLVVHGRGLVNNASQRLTEEGVPHGIIMAGTWRAAPKEPIQVCSIDTLKRRQHAPPADLVVIDEAHQAQCDSYHWLVAQYPEAFFLSVTATPHVKKGLRHIANRVVYPISINDLIQLGFLVPPRYYAPSKPDLSGVHTDSKTGDYVIKELADVMMGQGKLAGDLVTHYRELGENRPAVAFAVNIAHSHMIVAQFNEAGIPAAHMAQEFKDAQRAEMLGRLKSGELKVISNVGILGVGIDMPFVSAIILARPTKSYNLFIQQVGRGTRPCEGKADFLVLDHAGNIDKHGFIENERICDLDGEGRRAPGEKQPRTCQVCYFVWEPGEDEKPPYQCPECGDIPAKSEKEAAVVTVDATIKLAEIKRTKFELRARLDHFIIEAKSHLYKPGWVFHKIKGEFGEFAAKQAWNEIERRVPTPEPQFFD